MRVLGLFLAVFCACATENLAVREDAFSYTFTRKAPTNAFPAVGVIVSKKSLCTATLIAQDMIITAAHCVDDYSELQMFIAGDGESSFVSEKVGLSADNEATDVGFAMLTSPLRTKPMLVADAFPDADKKFAFVGYGCTAIKYEKAGNDGVRKKKTVGGGEKMVIHGTFSEFVPIVLSSKSMMVCNGDSGGPVIDVETNKIVLTASTTYTGIWKGKAEFIQSGFTPVYRYVNVIPSARVLMWYLGTINDITK